MGTKNKCVICGEESKLHYNPMEEWGVKGSICGNCYSKKIQEHYPGEHTRVNKHLD